MKVVSNGSFCSFLDSRAFGMIAGEAVLEAIPAPGMAKTASAGGNAVLEAVKAFVKALEAVQVKSGLSEEEMAGLSKEAAKPVTAESREETVRIASKSVKDSHYFIDVSLDPIEKKGKSLVMVSFLLREGYLGRYMIKRNFFYLPSNSAEAEATYGELVRKSRRVKARYLGGQSEPYDIMPEVKSFLDGVRGDFEFADEDSLGTTVRRDRESYHETAGAPYIRQT